MKWRERHLAVVTVSVCARLSVLVAMCVVVDMAGLGAPAQAQERFAATVTAVVDGDTSTLKLLVVRRLKSK